MLTETENDLYTPLVRQVFRVDSIEWADSKQPFVVRYTGSLLNDDSEAAYSRLSASLRPLDVTPLFRKDDEQQVVVLMRGVVKPGPTRWRTPIILFLLTVASVIFSMFLFSQNLVDSVLFALTLLTILLFHEFGHYLTARRHSTSATPPYFIPFPLSPFGTMGAVIVQKEAHRNKKIMLDIGMAGPLAGFLVGFPLLLLGLSLSEVGTLSAPAGMVSYLEGNSILYVLSKYLVFGRLLPAPVSLNGMPEIIWWLRYFFTGQPLPVGGADVMMHPIAYAAWAGMLVTALNLIPAGQLDGGHILNALAGKRARLLLPVILVGLVLLGFVWYGWWLWAALIFFLGRVPAEPLDQITPLDGKRKLLALFCLILFVLVFIPVPLQVITF